MTYTPHGHHIPGTTYDDELGQVAKARCGGIPMCTDCIKAMGDHFLKSGDPIDVDDVFDDTDEYADNPNRYIERAKLFVISAYNNRLGDNELGVSDLRVLAYNKVGENWAASIVTKDPDDGAYFLVTHIGERLETIVHSYLLASVDKFTPEGDDQP